jgi:hypothetical protein
MKKVVRCDGCERPVRLYGSFTAEITEKIKGTDVELPPRKIRLCRKCADYAGYKVK